MSRSLDIVLFCVYTVASVAGLIIIKAGLAPAQADITDTLSSPQKGRPAGPQYESPGPVA